MRKTLVLSTILALITTNAFANPISGSVSLNGTASYDDNNIYFDNTLGNIAANTASGDFATMFGSTGCMACVKLNDFNYTNLSAPVEVYDAVTNGVETTFTINSIVMENSSPSFVSLEATGYATLTNSDPTAGNMYFSSQGGQNTQVSFSTTTNAIPEPAGLAILGAGLVGLGFARKRKANTSAV